MKEPTDFETGQHVLPEEVMNLGRGRRRVLLINPKFQLTFLGYMVVMASFIILVLFASNMYFYAKCYEAGRNIGLGPEHVYFALLDSQRTTIRLIFLAASALTFINLLFWGLYLSHRVAGPVHRLTQYILDSAEGKIPSDVQFRKKDFFPELAEAFNRYVVKSAQSEHKKDS